MVDPRIQSEEKQRELTLLCISMSIRAVLFLEISSSEIMLHMEKWNLILLFLKISFCPWKMWRVCVCVMQQAPTGLTEGM